MTGKAFCAWLEQMKLSDRTAVVALGLGSRNTIAKYKVEGAPLYIALACAALARGLPPFGGEGQSDR